MEHKNKFVRKMPNKELVRIVNRIRDEKTHPEKYRNSRYIPESTFFKGETTNLKQELKRRQNEGRISRSAGKPRRRPSSSMWGNVGF